ncbi:hypothetical protein H5T55_05970 [Candidatus Bipolaricaulota bacterium]|nr:hypothetical protein [Candidatus Bipolaricaulota bacterium]
MSRLRVSIIGTAGSEPRYWPGMVFSSELAEGVVLALTAGPRSPREVARELQRSEAEVEKIVAQLQALYAVRAEEDGRLALDFSLLTAEDLRVVDEVAPSLGRGLAGHVLEGAEAIHGALDRLPGAESAAWRAQYTFATVGCMGLDWGGIATLQRLGYVSSGREYPDGGKYVLIAEERRAAVRAKDYCGSHTGGGDRYVFTSFGDHSGPRHCLPDLFFRVEWAVGKAEWPPGLAAGVTAVVAHGQKRLYDELGAMIAGERPAAGPCREFLARLGYLADGAPLVPVFTAAAAGPVREIVAAVAQAVAQWAERTVPSLGEVLPGLTPVRLGVDRGCILNHIWHFIVAEANRFLAEEGFMLDPEPGPEGQGRYLAWVAEAAFNRTLDGVEGHWEPAVRPAPGPGLTTRER